MSSSETSLLDRLKATGRLPSPVGVAIRVLALCRSEESEVHDIADAIMSDPALSARLLRYANSAAVGAGREVTSVKEAVLIMGLRALKLTALGFSLAAPEGRPRCPSFDYRRFWTESFLTATAARRLAAPRFDVWREEAFTAALLSRMGQLALAHGLPEQYNDILIEAATKRPVHEIEREQLGVDHAQFGAMLLSDWGLPEVLARAVEFHLDPDSAPQRVQPLARVIHLAKSLLPLFAVAGRSEAPPESLATARAFVEDTLHLDEAAWQQSASEVLADFEQVVDIFDMPGDDISVLALYADAQEEATRVGIVAQIEQNRTLEANRELLYRATTDPVTGIANRAKFEEKLDEATRGLRRGHGNFAVVLFDIDEFKKFNDNYGHEMGDTVLRGVARAAEESLREVDLVARYGGDELVILAPQTDAAGACIIAERLRHRIAQRGVERDGRRIGVTVSLGVVATVDYPQRPAAEQILADADKQLYLAKQRGRNCWSYRGRTLSAEDPPDRRPAGAA